MRWMSHGGRECDLIESQIKSSGHDWDAVPERDVQGSVFAK